MKKRSFSLWVSISIGLMSCAIGISLLVRLSLKESVRAELIQRQRQTGLTLAYFYRSIDTVLFADRSVSPGKEILPAGQAAGGAISPDGTEIAFLFWNPKRETHVGIMRPDGSNLREYPEVLSDDICWSYDKFKLAMDVQNLERGTTPPNDSLVILDLGSRKTLEIDVRAYVTSQCWSPGGKQIAYEADESVRVYDIERKMWSELAKGRQPTWSPDGNWIAFLDGDTYYAIRPSGEDRRVLFRKKGALSGLWWSPDSRVVAYVSYARFFESPFWKVMDVGSVRLRVRRLDDDSEDWVAELSDAYVPRFQWVRGLDRAGQDSSKIVL